MHPLKMADEFQQMRRVLGLSLPEKFAQWRDIQQEICDTIDNHTAADDRMPAVRDLVRCGWISVIDIFKTTVHESLARAVWEEYNPAIRQEVTRDDLENDEAPEWKIAILSE